jgi:hypothetical protein
MNFRATKSVRSQIQNSATFPPASRVLSPKSVIVMENKIVQFRVAERQTVPTSSANWCRMAGGDASAIFEEAAVLWLSIWALLATGACVYQLTMPAI